MNDFDHDAAEKAYAYPAGDSGTAPVRERLEPKDKKQILLLAAMDIALLLFISVYLIVSGVRSLRQQKRYEEFDPAAAYYDPASALSSLSPTLPAASYPAGIQPGMMALYGLNNDTVGWLYIPGTGIDHAVVQGVNNDEYIHADFFRRSDKRTRLYFADYRNVFSPNLQDYSKVTIIYGHHLSADTRIFAELENYMDVEYYRQHPIVELDTLYGGTVWKVFGCFICSIDEQKEPVFYYWNPDIADADVARYCSEILTRSGFLNPAVMDFRPTDKFLCLSTCTYQIENDRDNRCVLMARLLRPGESTEVDVSGAYQHTDCRMPHAWYEQNGLADPYRNTPVFTAMQ